MENFKGKETLYGGVRYRSKQEAKWSFILDFLCLRQMYEPTTVTGWNGTIYKPDFYLPDFGVYAEVKTNTEGIQNEAMATKLNGAIDYNTTPVSKGLLLLGAIPYDVRTPSIRIKTKWLFWHKGVCCADAYIQQSSYENKATLILTGDNIDTGDPLPHSASPDLFLEPYVFGYYITQAINAANDYFKGV